MLDARPRPVPSILAMSTTQISTNVHAVKPGDVLPGKDGATYRILKLIGEGGFSVVHEAECEQTKVHYAVKSLQMRHKASEKAQTRQHREAKTLRKLRHPNVVHVHHVGVREEDGLIFMIMDLLVGRTLRELQRDLGGRLPIPWALEIIDFGPPAPPAKGRSKLPPEIIQ